MKRTATVEPGTDFEVEIPITKAFVDTKTGQRHIVGTASGIREDRDGERASQNCVKGMVRDVDAGGVKLTSGHQQDWLTEIGDVLKAEHDSETDEFIIDTVIPPEGVDAIADKAWRAANNEKVGFSVGGKLLKSYFERTEVGKKRKVLDAIKLRHIALTKNPSYQYSFAQAIAKTWEGDEPVDDEFTLDVDDEVEKDSTTGSWVSGSSEAGGGNTGRDSVGSGQRNAGTKRPGSKGMSTEDDGSDDDDDDRDLPKVQNERRLACPNCGHEFAADLPVDPDERQLDSNDDNDKNEDEATTGKSVDGARAKLMSTLDETLDALKALADGADVTKTNPDPPEDEGTGDDTQTDDGALDVAKLVAASHKANTDRIDQIEKGIGEGFELIAKSHKAIVDMVENLPQGRKSVARVLPSAVGHDDNRVEKTTEELIAETDDPLTALKISNAATWGVE